MNKVTVTFAGETRNITIDFTHNLETESLDYNVTVDPPINEGETLDLASFLADRFLGSLLTTNEEIQVIPDGADSDI